MSVHGKLIRKIRSTEENFLHQYLTNLTLTKIFEVSLQDNVNDISLLFSLIRNVNVNFSVFKINTLCCLIPRDFQWDNMDGGWGGWFPDPARPHAGDRGRPHHGRALAVARRREASPGRPVRVDGLRRGTRGRVQSVSR